MTRAAITGPVALMAPRYWPATGGVERHVERLAEGLAQRGIETEILATDPTGTLSPRERRNGVLVRRFPVLRHDARFFLSPALSAWLYRNAGRYALLHAHSYHTPMPLQAAIAARRHGVPFIVTSHYHGTGHSPLRRFLHGPYRPLGRWATRRSRAVICMTEGERDLVHRHFGPNVSTALVPGAVDLDEIAAAGSRVRKHDETLVMTVSRLEEYKQIHLLLAALRYLPERYRVIVVGDGPARPRLEKEIVRFGIGSRVRLMGHVSRADLLSWYRTADIFVSLSRMEALGLTLVEALTAGLAAVASDIPAHREVAALAPLERVIFTDAVPSPDLVADAVRRAARAGKLAEVQSWSFPGWEGMVDGTIDVYRDALRARPRRALEPARQQR